MLYRVARDVTRVAARSGGQRKPAAPKPAPAMTGPAWVFLVVFIIAGAGLAELFEKYWHAGRGAAFLMAFGVLVTVLFVVAGLAGGGSKSSTATQIRAAHAEQERAKRDRARQVRAGLPAEMEEAEKEAEAWKAGHPQMFR